MAENLGAFGPLVGGSEFIHSLLSPLELLASGEENRCRYNIMYIHIFVFKYECIKIFITTIGDKVE